MKRSGWNTFLTPVRWLRRMLTGASRAAVKTPVESKPSRRIWQDFFRNRLAVGALILLLGLFLFAFVGQYFFPMDVGDTDPLQANIAPNFSMLAIPRELKNQVRDINGYANFTVGVSEDNTLYMWGYTKDPLSGRDYADFPEEIREGNVLYASAGADHVIAVTTDGRVIGWGNDTLGQYGHAVSDASIVSMPQELIDVGVTHPERIDQLTCGYQATALVVEGKLYLWGNAKALLNMRELARAVEDYREARGVGVRKVAMSGFYAVALFEDGTMTGSELLFHRESAVSSRGGRIKNFTSYLEGKRIVDIAATGSCYAFLLEDGEVLVSGAAEYGEDEIAAVPEGEKIVALAAGTRHFLALTDAGTVLSWGQKTGGQTDVSGKSAARIFTGARQSYLCDREGRLTEKSGFRGYLFGTDGRGRDVFTRVVHGGKMTLTIGAVAVLIASAIAIVIGCLSGYFGGWVDLFLMRVTEIFASIPFLPFAMLLSFVLRNYPIGETTRIFLIMVILGLLSWTGPARMIRAQVLSEREKEFVTAAHAMGVSRWRIAFRHILPNIVSVILVSMTLDFAGCLLTESSLSYLGFGVQQPYPTWGNMLSGANNGVVIASYPWQWGFPALFLALATISINVVGDALRDALDPKGGHASRE